MADESLAFATASRVVEERTGFSPAQARGTVRLALQEAGLFDAEVTASQMSVVAGTLLDRELRGGGVVDADAVCEAVRAALAGLPELLPDDAPEAVFARLGLLAAPG